MVQQKDYENLKIKVNGIPVPSVCNSQSFQNPNDESEESEEVSNAERYSIHIL